MVRVITDQEKKMLLSIQIGDLTYDKFLELIGSKMSKVGGKVTHTKSKFETTDIVNLKKGEYFNKTDIQTTVGRVLFNKFIVEKDLVDVLGFINEPINGGKLNKLEDSLSKALQRDDITVQQMIEYLDNIQWLGMQLHNVIAGSYSINMLKPVPAMQKHRDKLIKENKKALDDGDVLTAVRIEKECLDIATKAVANDPTMELFDAGARGSIGNNYKNISVMKGPVYNPATGKFELVQSNFMEGIRKEELAIQGNAVVTGALKVEHAA